MAYLHLSLPLTFIFCDLLTDTSDVEIDVRESDEYVIIKSVDAGVAVALTRFRHTYTMVVRMADSAYDISTGMLKACPADEIISIETSEFANYIFNKYPVLV